MLKSWPFYLGCMRNSMNTVHPRYMLGSSRHSSTGQTSNKYLNRILDDAFPLSTSSRHCQKKTTRDRGTENCRCLPQQEALIRRRELPGTSPRRPRPRTDHSDQPILAFRPASPPSFLALWRLLCPLPKWRLTGPRFLKLEKPSSPIFIGKVPRPIPIQPAANRQTDEVEPLHRLGTHRKPGY
jgi:hypothetical protein